MSEGEMLAEPSGAKRAAGYYRPQGETADVPIRRSIAAGNEHHVTALYGRWGAAAHAMAGALGIGVDDV